MLIDAFYKQVTADRLIGFFFTEVLKLNWDHHIPIMYSFWESVVLGTGSYTGNPVIKHVDLHKKETLNATHFDRWLELWNSTIDQLFRGEKADEAKAKAQVMAKLMLFKIEASEQSGHIQ